MARSTSTRRTTRTTRTSRSTRPSSGSSRTPRTSARRNLKYFTFQYSRDDVSHTRNANNVTIVDRNKGGATVSLSLQEAKSLYDFLGSQIRTR